MISNWILVLAQLEDEENCGNYAIRRIDTMRALLKIVACIAVPCKAARLFVMEGLQANSDRILHSTYLLLQILGRKLYRQKLLF